MDFETVKKKAMHILQFLQHLRIRHPEMYKSLLKEVKLPNGTLTTMEKIITTLKNILNNGSDSFRNIATELAMELMPNESTIDAIHTIFNTTLLYVIKENTDANILYWIFTESRYEYTSNETLGKKKKAKKTNKKRKHRA